MTGCPERDISGVPVTIEYRASGRCVWEDGVNPLLPRNCDRGRNPHDATVSVDCADGKARGVG